MVAAYEVFVAQSGGAAPPPRAPLHDANQALSKLKEAFLEIGFLPSQNPEARFVEWRELFGRAGLTPREVKLLLALARRIANTGRVANRAKSSNAS